MATWAKGVDFKNASNTTRVGGVGVYGTDNTAEKIYLGIGSEPWNNAGLQITSTSINFKGNKVYHAGDKPTAADVGALTQATADGRYIRQVNANGYYGMTANGDTSNWVRTTNSGIIPYASGGASSLGTSSWPFNDIYANNIYDNGVLLENKFAAASHSHSYLPLSGGTITSSSFGPLIIKRSGSTSAGSIQFANDNGTLGSIGMTASPNGGLIRWNTDTNISYNILDTGNYKTYVTPANIGAAAASHSHSYLPLAGGNMTGKVTNSFATNTYLAGNQGNALINSSTGAGAYVMLYRYPSTNGYFTTGGYQGNYLLQYTAKSTVDAGTNSVTKSVTLLNESGNSSFPGTVSAAAFSGNATTATTLATARTINGTSFNGSANITTANWGTARTIKIGNTSKSVNGSANVTWTLAEIGVGVAHHWGTASPSNSDGKPDGTVYFKYV